MKRLHALISIISCFSLFAHNFDYDLIVIGAGASGLTAVNIASDLGKKVLLIEKQKIGGGRLWSGDIPFKILFKKAEVLHQTENLIDFGIGIKQEAVFNTEGILKNVCTIRDKIFDQITNEIVQKNIDIIIDSPSFVDEHTIQIQDRLISSQFFIISTGASTSIPAIEGLEEVPYFTRENFFDEENLPSSMIIVGGGPLGVEMASSLNRLGVKTTLIMRHGMILPTYDFEMAGELAHVLQKEGVTIHCDMDAKQIKKNNEGLIELTSIDRAGIPHTHTAHSLFVATGSKTNVEGLGLEKIQLAYSNNGIHVRPTMQTNIDHIYACGDVVGLIILSRIAYYHAKTAIFNMFRKKDQIERITNYVHVVKVVFTDPLLASSGLSEQEARKLFGNTIKVYYCDYDKIDKAFIDHNLTGNAKFICDQKGHLIGAHILGAYAGELLDSLLIGKRFDQMFLYESAKIRTSPSYFDIIQRVAHKCLSDLGKTALDLSKEMTETPSEPSFISKVQSFFTKWWK